METFSRYRSLFKSTAEEVRIQKRCESEANMDKVTKDVINNKTETDIFKVTEDLIANEKESFEIVWEKLSYSITNNWFNRSLKKIQGFHEPPKQRTILNDLNGSVQSGQLVAFIGPSGAGKSTLLECIVGRRNKGKSGDISIYANYFKTIKLSFIAQKNDGLISQLTVRESIYFAARLQCATKAKMGILEYLHDENGTELLVGLGGHSYCEVVTDRLLTELGLESCANNRLPSCSGGQLKRLAIAQQLVARPRILVLDEPTSGLDSSSCFQVIDILLKLTQSKPQLAVIATIHQPSYKILNMFHKLYIIAGNGNCIYEGKPQNLVEHLKSFNVICPPNYNPSELLVEIACGEHGQEIIEDLTEFHRSVHYRSTRQSKSKKKRELSIILENNDFPHLSHIHNLCRRNMLVLRRNPFAFALRFTATIAVSLFMTSIFGTDIGTRGGCPPNFDANFEPSQLKQIGDEIKVELTTMFNNTGNIFFVVLFIMFNTILPTCLSFPNEMITFRDEKANQWYSMREFYFGKLAADVPIQILLITIYLPITYFLQSQPPDLWRFMSIYLILNQIQFTSQTLGYIIGAIFMYNIPAAVFIGPTMFTPLVLLTGVFIKVKTMPPFFARVSYISYLRFAVEGFLVALYGFDRCGLQSSQELIEGKEAFVIWMSAMIGVYDENPDTSAINETVGVASQKFVEELIDKISGSFVSDNNEVRSAMMNYFSLEDFFLHRSFLFMSSYCVISLYLAYIVIRMRSKIDN